MRKLFIFILALSISLSLYADRTFSFGQISCYSPQAGMISGGGSVISITIGDGYIIHPLYGKLYAVQRNMDGSTTYLPSEYAGTPMAQLQGILISNDLQQLEEHLTTTFGGMTCNMINTYTNAGEDGGRYANSWAYAQSVANDRSKDREIRTNRNSGICERCHGTRVDPILIDYNPGHRTKTSKIPAYTTCPHCNERKSIDHWHQRCLDCSSY